MLRQMFIESEKNLLLMMSLKCYLLFQSVFLLLCSSSSFIHSIRICCRLPSRFLAYSQFSVDFKCLVVLKNKSNHLITKTNFQLDTIDKLKN